MAIDWTEIYTKYKGRWIALEDDEQTMVGSGNSAREALDQAREKGCETPATTLKFPYPGLSDPRRLLATTSSGTASGCERGP